METLSYRHKAQERAAGSKSLAIIGVVASGNLEVMVERVLPDTECQVDINTAAEGFAAVWEAVVADFVERRALAQHVSCEAVPQQMRADVFLRRLEACLREGAAKDRIENLRIDELTVRRLI